MATNFIIIILNCIVFLYSGYFIIQWLRSIKSMGMVLYPGSKTKGKIHPMHRRYIGTTKDLIYKISLVWYFIAFLISSFLIIQPLFKENIQYTGIELLISWLFIYNAIMGTTAFEIREKGILKNGYFYNWSKVIFYKITSVTRTHKHYGLGEPGKDYVEFEFYIPRKLLPSKVSYLVEAEDEAFIENIFKKNGVGEDV